MAPTGFKEFQFTIEKTDGIDRVALIEKPNGRTDFPVYGSFPASKGVYICYIPFEVDEDSLELRYRIKETKDYGSF